MADTLPFRVCDLCGQVDDHPRHVIAGTLQDVYMPDDALRATLEANIEALVNDGTIDLQTAFRLGRDYADTSSQDRHMDCCAAAGCPTGTCVQVQDKHSGKQGSALRKAIMSERKD